MQLTHFTDLGLRVLMDLTVLEPGTSCRVADIAARFNESHNHLRKVVHFMAQQGWLQTTRGPGGGICLSEQTTRLPLGKLVRTLERCPEVIDCAATPCALRGRCSLKVLLEEANAAFYRSLDRYTLADTLAAPTRALIARLQTGSATAPAHPSEPSVSGA